MNKLSLLSLLFISSFVGAQSEVDRLLEKKDTTYENEFGLFPIQNFTHQETGGHHQNWAITQDKTGFIYTGNGKGVLEYDGVSWRLISSPGLHAVRAVVADEKNVKWIGADRELGYLEPDSLGFLQFKSLKHKIPPSHPLSGNVWQIFPENDRILFVTETAIYSWTENHFRVIPREGEIHRANQDLYFRVQGKGMYRLIGEVLEPIPDGEKLQNIRIDVVLPYRNRSVLFASRESGIFVFDGKTVAKFENGVDDFIIRNNLYTGLILSDSSYVFGTLRGGVIMMDKYGKRTKEITTKEGILNNQVYGMMQDSRKSLWLALQTGISQIEAFLPYTFFDKSLGLEGTVTTIVRHNDKLFVGTYDGLFTQETNSRSSPARFTRVDGIKNGCFSLLSIGKDLLAGSASGVFLISNGRVSEIKKLTACRALCRWKKDPTVIFLGHRGGLSALKFKNGKWQHEEDFEAVDGEIRSITEDDQGSLWLGTTLHKILKVEFAAEGKKKQSKLDDIKVSYYDDQHGLPKETNSVYLVDGELWVYVFSEKGSLLKLDFTSGKFLKTTEFGKKFGLDSLTIYPIGYQNDGAHVLLGSEPMGGKSYRFSASRNSMSGKYKTTRVYDDRFRSTTENPVYWDQENLLWFGGEYITRYDVNAPVDVTTHFKTHLRKVTLGRDAAIYGGEKSMFLQPSLEYSNNGLRFEFAAPDFMGKDNTKFQYQLIGFDTKWSEWTKETKKDYTNLPEGNYQFVVRSQNIFGELSTADAFNLEILSPWYRTWWAYVLYVILFVGFLFFSLQLRARKLESEKKALELIVAERTEEIRAQANQLKIQAEKLQELDQVKSRFFANISHEFRTPLTLISGSVEDLIADSDGEQDQVRLAVMKKNTKRLRQLIEQLLDLSKLESGKLSIKVAGVNPSNFLRAITSSFSSWADQKKITLSIDLSGENDFVYFDQDVLDKVINNLLSNALKFTPSYGEVSLSAQWTSEILSISVSDNGFGIPTSKLNKIFDRFYQVDDTSTRTQEGSGIGLALVKELVALHHGHITVKSEQGVRTVFSITIPVDRNYYPPAEIVSDPEINVQKEFNKDENLNIVGESDDEFQVKTTENPLVLVVEDNVDLARYIAGHLNEFEVILTGNGKEGFDKATRYVPDLIISDVMMPEMDGVELCKKIKEEERTSHIPIILLTAKADIESRLEGLETGADDYITKPFDTRELQTRVKNLIQQREKLRSHFSRTVVLKPKDIAITPPDEIFLEKVMAIIEVHLADSEFSMEDFQQEIGMSRMQLHRKLKALTGHSAGEFIRIQRLIRASDMLSKTSHNISEVCYQTGFTSLSYFAKCFKRQFGTTPKDFAALHAQQH